MKYAHLEEIVLVQARELKAQRTAIERLSRENRDLRRRVEAGLSAEDVRDSRVYRLGYGAGFAAASRKIRKDKTTRAGDAVNVPALATEG